MQLQQLQPRLALLRPRPFTIPARPPCSHSNKGLVIRSTALAAGAVGSSPLDSTQEPFAVAPSANPATAQLQRLQEHKTTLDCLALFNASMTVITWGWGIVVHVMLNRGVPPLAELLLQRACELVAFAWACWWTMYTAYGLLANIPEWIISGGAVVLALLLPLAYCCIVQPSVAFPSMLAGGLFCFFGYACLEPAYDRRVQQLQQELQKARGDAKGTSTAQQNTEA